MLDDNQIKKVGNLIKSYLEWAQTVHPVEALLNDPVRGGVRPEILAAVLYGSATIGFDSSLEEECVKFLIAIQNSSGMWLESPYGTEDEKIGCNGTVTTCWVLLALIASFERDLKNITLLKTIVMGADALYRSESNGHVKKSDINKGSVLNTNLLAGIVFQAAAKILPKKSRRRELYEEATRRILRKVIGYQRLDGNFPYHFETIRHSILYQAMVCAELRFILESSNNPIVNKVYSRAMRALKSIYSKECRIYWDKSDLDDKKGAVWAYSFSITSLPQDMSELVLKHLADSQTDGLFLSGIDHTSQNLPDPFYSAWVVFGLIWSYKNKSIPISSSPAFFRMTMLKFEYLVRLGVLSLRYVVMRANKQIFHLGSAIENASWNR